MNPSFLKTALLMVAVAVVSAGSTYWWTHPATKAGAANSMSMAPATGGDRKVLYWYDPMKPEQHFDKPGKSPFMDMQLMPKYADEAGAGGGLQIDSRLTQNLGMRVADVEQGMFSQPIRATASVMFNERNVAIVQTRTNGFVQRVYARAPGDVVAQGAPLVDILVPEWAGAQAEYLALRQSGDKGLTQAAGERLLLLGMPESLIQHLKKTGQVQNTVTLSAPIAGVIQSVDIRQGMTVSSGMTVARLNGLSSVWLEAAVPESQSNAIKLGQAAQATVAGLADQEIQGQVLAVLPEINEQSRTTRVRMEFPNPKGLLRPGMFAQVQFNASAWPNSLMVPSEAVIRTGKRSVVLLAEDGGRYAPVEVALGPEANGKTVILSGLQAGQRVVASGQFLIDSEASLSGVVAQLSTPAPASTAAVAAPGIEAQGVIEAVKPGEITVSHQPIAALGWPAMTMPFALTKTATAAGLKPGQHIHFTVEKQGDAVVITHIDIMEGM